jgi:hypothetical protein
VLEIGYDDGLATGYIRYYADQGQVLFDRDLANGDFTSNITG